jgi:hypothetical protein
MDKSSVQSPQVSQLHIPFPSSSPPAHANVGSDDHLTTFASYKCDELLGVGHASREDSIGVCRNLEAFYTAS